MSSSREILRLFLVFGVLPGLACCGSAVDVEKAAEGAMAINAELNAGDASTEASNEEWGNNSTAHLDLD